VRRPPVPVESPTLGLGHLQFEALITTARLSVNINDFALIAMLGLLGLRVFEACGASIGDLGEEHGHRVLKVRGKGDKTVLIPLPPAVARAIDRAGDGRDHGPILRNAPRRADGAGRGDPTVEAVGRRGGHPDRASLGHVADQRAELPMTVRRDSFRVRPRSVLAWMR
jgi:integrase